MTIGLLVRTGFKHVPALPRMMRVPSQSGVRAVHPVSPASSPLMAPHRPAPCSRLLVAGVALFFLLFYLRFFSPLLFSRHEFLRHDAGFDYHSVHFIVNSLAVTGDIPLWNPFNNCGEPFYFTHNWISPFNPITFAVAMLAVLLPALAPAKIYMGVLAVLWAALSCGHFLFLRDVSGSRFIAFAASIMLSAMAVETAYNGIPVVNAYLLLPVIMYALERLCRPPSRRAVIPAAAVIAFAITQHNTSLREMLVAIFLYAGCVAAASPARIIGLLQRRHLALALAACVIIATALVPKLIVLGDSSGQVLRVGGSSTLGGFARVTPVLLLQHTLRCLAWPLDGDRCFPNLLLVFFPFALASPRGRVRIMVMLCLMAVFILGSQPLVFLLRLLSPFADARSLGGNLSYFPVMLYVLALAISGLGLASYLRPPAQPRNRANTFGLILQLLLLPALLGCYLAATVGSSPEYWFFLPGFAYFALLKYLPGVNAFPRVRAGLMFGPVGLGMFLFAGTIPRLDYNPRDFPGLDYAPRYNSGIAWDLKTESHLLAHCQPYHHRGQRTDLGVRGIPDDYVCIDTFLRPMVTQELFIYGTVWRTAGYDRYLRRLPPDRRADLLRTGRAVCFITGNYRGYQTEAEMFRQLSDPAADSMALLAPQGLEIVRQSALGPGQPAATVTVTDFGPNHIVLQAATSDTAILVYADAYDPRWQAAINARPTAIFTVNGMFKGVVIPPGNSQVVFQYRHPLFLASVWLSMLALVITGFFIFYTACCPEKRPA